MITELKTAIENGTHIDIHELLNDKKVVGDIGKYEKDAEGKEAFQSVYGNAVILIDDTKSTLEEIQTALEGK